MAAVSPVRALVVDDNDDAGMTLATLLKHCGHHAMLVSGGEAALERAPSLHPDVIFIDLAMPQVNGFDVAGRLRQMAEFAQTPLIAVSGFTDAESRAKAAAAGFTDFLVKPYPLAVLQATLERITISIDASRQRAETSRAVAEQTRQMNETARRELDLLWRELRRPAATVSVNAVAVNAVAVNEVAVNIEKSGISRSLTLTERSTAEELRLWLKEQRCRVGPVFESGVEQFSFFVYSRRQELGRLVAQHGKFRVSA
ncbi:MAG TPA: response regulator [Pirellulales bacterium]